MNRTEDRVMKKSLLITLFFALVFAGSTGLSAQAKKGESVRLHIMYSSSSHGYFLPCG